MILSGLAPSVNSGSDGHDKVLQVPLFQLDQEIQIVTGIIVSFIDGHAQHSSVYVPDRESFRRHQRTIGK
jgi:hypothetical protein